MQLWFYPRDCQLGDYVYADGTFSDILDKSKTVVGVCFYIDPYDKSHRLCVGGSELGSYPWGLYSGSWNEGITLPANENYGVFDIPTLTNKNTGSNTSHTVSNYRDENSGDPDGFKIQASNLAISELGWVESDIDFKDIHKGDSIPWGLANTLKIIQHREIILHSVTPILPSPTTSAELLTLLNKIVSENGNQAIYQQYYYPAASLCHLYQPSIKEGEKLAGSFKSGRWFLPSIGEYIRFLWHAKYNRHQQEASNGIYASAIAANVFGPIRTTLSTWCSTEASATASWVGLIYSNNPHSNSLSKNQNNIVRPVCAF